jgi:hypothetical protein
LARSLVGLSGLEIEELALKRIVALPDESFFDVATELLRAVDVIYFNDHLLEAEAPFIRQRLIDRLVASYGWRDLIGRRSGSIEIHLGPCVGTVFFNDYFWGHSRTYLTPKAIERIDPFLSLLIDLAAAGPSYFVALVTMDLLEISPRPSLIPLIMAGAKAWLRSYADDTNFWIDHDIGRRFCEWIDHIRSIAPEYLPPTKVERQDIDRILAALVELGLPEARQLESALAIL